MLQSSSLRVRSAASVVLRPLAGLVLLVAAVAGGCASCNDSCCGGCGGTCGGAGNAAVSLACASCGGPGAGGVAGFERFKSLAAEGGRWQATMPPPSGGAAMTVPMHYKVISAGSVVCETLFEGTPNEMITVYHLDKGVLTATHYCALGNQPRMRATVCACTAGSTSCAFVFRDGTNMDPATDECMGKQTYTFNPDGSLKIQWYHLGPGGVVKTDGGMPALTFSRVK